MQTARRQAKEIIQNFVETDSELYQLSTVLLDLACPVVGRMFGMDEEDQVELFAEMFGDPQSDGDQYTANEFAVKCVAFLERFGYLD